TSLPRDSHVRYAETASTSGDVGVGSSSELNVPPVVFSLRRKHSAIRSPRLNRRPARLLYSGKSPATPTSGSDFSRWPPFIWQLLHDIPPGASRGTSRGVSVKILKPRLISSDSGNGPSAAASASGVFGNSQAVTIVALAAMSGPFIAGPLDVCVPGAPVHPTARCATRTRNALDLSVMRRGR